MWDLDYRKYRIIHFENSPISPWIINQDSLQKIQQLASQIESIKNKKKEKYPYDTYLYLQDSCRQYSEAKEESVDYEKILSNLGIKSRLWPSDTFLDQEKYKKFKEESDCLLLSEKNLIPQIVSIGSSRHALGIGYQFKGVGKNSMAHDEDYYHSWGGFVSRDALDSLLTDKVLIKRTKLGCLRTDAVFKYTDLGLGKVPLVLALRENNTYRLSQIVDHFISEAEREVLKNSLFNQFDTKNEKIILSQIIDHYVHAFSVGCLQQSISQENLTLDGRFIDTESIDYTKDSKQVPFYLSIGFDPNLVSLKGQEHFKDVISDHSKCFFYTTWIHDLLLIAELTSNAFKIVFKREFDWKTICMSHIEQYFPGELEKWKVFLDFESYSRKFHYSSQFPIDEFNLEHNLLKNFSRYSCVGQFFDLHTKKDKCTFSESQEHIAKYGQQLLLKNDVAFWKTPLTWEQSFQNWKKING